MLKIRFKKIKKKNKNYYKKKKLNISKLKTFDSNILLNVFLIKFKKYTQTRVFISGRGVEYLICISNNKYNSIKLYLHNFYFLAIKDSISIIKFSKKYKLNTIINFSSYLQNSGLKLYCIKNINQVISNIYMFIHNKDKLLLTSDYNTIDNSNQLVNFIENSTNIKNINFFFIWLIERYKPTFDVKCVSIEKKKKKTKQPNKRFKLQYISSRFRLKLSLKHLKLIINQSNQNKLSFRLSDSLLDMFFNYKDSKLFVRKLFIYSQVFKI